MRVRGERMKGSVLERKKGREIRERMKRRENMSERNSEKGKQSDDDNNSAKRFVP